MNSVRIDIALREITLNLPHKFIEILTNKKGGKLLDSSLLEMKDKIADLIVLVEYNSIFHFEVQNFNNKDMAFSMLEYFLLICQKYNNKKIY